MTLATPSQVIGFAQGAANGRPDAPARPTPLPKRPKGRWFVGGILLAIIGVAGYSVWNSFFRYQAYGTVTGHEIQVSPPWDGVLRFVHVHEGDTVRQGQLLLTVENVELQQRHAQLGDELRVAQANLDAECARLKWQAAFNLDQGRGAKVVYFEAWGNLLREQARLDDLRSQLRRAELLHLERAVSQGDVEQLGFAVKGQSDLVAKLKEALPELATRADQADVLLKKASKLSAGFEDNGYDQLKPFFARIESLQADRARIQERLDQGQVRAPANGLVVKVRHFTGEHCKPGEPIVSLLEEGSLEVVLYLPQDSSTILAQDAEVKLVLDPYPEPLTCRVQRLGDEFEPAPEHLKRHYREGQRLLPVHLRPGDESARWMALRLGGIVKLTYFPAKTLEAPSD
jgi:multidrug resistance efflux pump